MNQWLDSRDSFNKAISASKVYFEALLLGDADTGYYLKYKSIVKKKEAENINQDKLVMSYF